MARHKVPPFRCPVKRKCAQCDKHIEPGQDAWVFYHHVFDSPECIDLWVDIRSLL